MGNVIYSEIKGFGKIRIRKFDGFIVVFIKVKYMLIMERNLILYRCLENVGCSYDGDNFIMKFYNDGEEVIVWVYIEGLYYF